MAKVGVAKLYRVSVDPAAGVGWTGMFNFKPNAYQVEEAIRLEISNLDTEVEHEADAIEALQPVLQLVTFHQPELLGEVSIAGTYVGNITIEPLHCFGMVNEAMMPGLYDTPEIPLVDIQDIVRRRVEAGQFDIKPTEKPQ